MRAKPYPKYTASGVEWLRDVPEHWGVKRLKLAAHLTDKKIEADEENPVPYIGMENIESWTGRMLPINLDVVPIGTANAFKAGHTLFGKLRPYLAKACNPDFDGLCSTELLVLKGADLDRRVLLYLLLSDGFIKLVDSSTYGSKMPRASWDFVGSCMVPIAPPDEQRAIAVFLDHETARIDALIEKKQTLIDRLKEKRTALISRTVTRGLPPEAARAAGLDAHPKLKPSGIDWLGDVPSHWTIPPLYTRYQVDLGKMLNEGAINGDHLVPYLRNVDVQWDRVNVSDLPEMDIGPWELARYTIKRGDVLVCEGGEVGRAAMVEENAHGLGYQKALHRLRPLTVHENPRFIFYTLYWAAHQGIFIAGGNPNTIPHLTGEKLRQYRFPAPPSAEQRAIAVFLDRETAKLDNMISKVEVAIGRLQEYRAALITAAVTGKIDLRGHSADNRLELASAS